MEPSITDWIVAVATALTFLVAAAAAMIGLTQVFDSRSLRRDQARPYVIVDFAFRGTLILIEIRNAGTTPARDVSIKFAEPLQSSRSGRAALVAGSAAFSGPIPMLAPGRRIQYLLDDATAVFSSKTLPRQYSVTVSYTDMAPRRRWARSGVLLHRKELRYSDPPFVLDLNQYAKSINAQKGIHELVTSVDTMRKTLDRWTDGFSGLRVNVSNRDRSALKERLEGSVYEFMHVRKRRGFRAAIKVSLKEIFNFWPR